jgi:gamma-glutamyl-gamma-aminobutyrate hydrolase PuuD
MPSNPLIAVVCARLPAGRVSMWPWDAFAIPAPYVEAIRRAGGRPVLLPPPDGGLSLEPFDGLLLAGGGDIDPSHFGANAHPNQYGLDPERDALEIGMVRLAADAGFPTLAICRGAQVVNVALGGTLHQHLPDIGHLGPHGVASGSGGSFSMHEVKLAEGSRLADAAGLLSATVASAHHQGLDRLGQGLRPVAWTGDGLVEAVEHERGWLVGVQWHPEQTATTNPSQQGLFDALVARSTR